MKYLFTIGTNKKEVVDGEEKTVSKYYKVVASNAFNALGALTHEPDFALENVDYVSKNEDIMVVD